MLALFEAMQNELPEAEHFILSARTRAMRAATLAWLRRHGLVPRDGTVCFVPSPAVKPRVWRQLAREGQLVIVDDLSYNHESAQPSVYDDLVEYAKQSSRVYIGAKQIAEISADSQAVEKLVTTTVETLRD